MVSWGLPDETTTFTLTGINDSDFEQQAVIKIIVTSDQASGIYWVVLGGLICLMRQIGT